MSRIVPILAGVLTAGLAAGVAATWSQPVHAQGTTTLRADIESKLRARDYSALRTLEQRRSSYVVEACRDQRRFNLVVSRSTGEITQRERLGWCSDDQRQTTIVRPTIIVSELESKRRLTGQECQDLMTAVAGDTQILFDKSSADLSPDAQPLLTRIARIANRCATARIEVAGHTDTDGTRDLNKVLSERRAQVVVEQLVRDGVKLSRLQAVGYGEERPISRDKTLNRRIEFVLDWGVTRESRK